MRAEKNGKPASWHDDYIDGKWVEKKLIQLTNEASSELMNNPFRNPVNAGLHKISVYAEAVNF